MPTAYQAGVYSAVTHYLKAVKALGNNDTKAVIDKMKATPVDDFFAHNGHIRGDGRMVHDMYLVQVKSPAESKGEWDIYKVLKTLPGDEGLSSARPGRLPAGRQGLNDATGFHHSSAIDVPTTTMLQPQKSIGSDFQSSIVCGCHFGKFCRSSAKCRSASAAIWSADVGGKDAKRSWSSGTTSPRSSRWRLPGRMSGGVVWSVASQAMPAGRSCPGRSGRRHGSGRAPLAAAGAEVGEGRGRCLAGVALAGRAVAGAATGGAPSETVSGMAVFGSSDAKGVTMNVTRSGRAVWSG